MVGNFLSSKAPELGPVTGLDHVSLTFCSKGLVSLTLNRAPRRDSFFSPLLPNRGVSPHRLNSFSRRVPSPHPNYL